MYYWEHFFLVVLIIAASVFFLATPVMLIVMFVRIGKMRQEIRSLRMGIDDEPGKSGPPLPAHTESGEGRGKPSLPARTVAPCVPPPPQPPPAPLKPTAPTPRQPTAPAPFQPTALDLFWRKVGDWLLVRGSFAPAGTTHEFAFATRWLVRVGVVLVAASVVYFIKLSIDRGWMGPSGRVAATILWGAAGAVVGTVLVKRTRYGAIGHAMAALGVVSLYLGFGMGHRFFVPPVIPSAPLAFAALAGVTLFAGFVSIVLPSPFIATMALVGGYAVPVIAGHDSGSPHALCLYMLILDAMAFAVARFRRWSALDFLSATLAYITLFAWCGKHGPLGAGHLLTVTAFFTLFHAIYMLGVVMDSGRRGKAGNAIAWSGLALNACIYAAFLASYFQKGFSSEYTGLVLLGLVAAYLAVGAACIRSGRVDRATVNILLVFALAFLAIAPLLLFDAVWCTLAWSAIAVAASEAEGWSGQKALGIMAILIMAAAALAGLFWAAPTAYGMASATPDPFPAATSEGYAPALLKRILRLWAIPAAAALVGRRSRGWLYVAACILGFLCFTAEAVLFGRAFLPSFGGGTLTVAWMLLAAATVWFGIARRNRAVRIVALVLAGIAVAKLLLIDTAHLATPSRVAVFAITGVLLIAGAFLYIRFKERFETHG